MLVVRNSLPDTEFVSDLKGLEKADEAEVSMPGAVFAKDKDFGRIEVEVTGVVSRLIVVWLSLLVLAP